MGLSEFITSLPELIGNAIEANQWLGYSAILLSMFLENLIPPIPSEIIMPLGGYYVYQEQLNFFLVVLSGLIGTVLGALPWYGIGRLVNEERLEAWLNKYGNWLGIRSNDLSKSRIWFERYGISLVFWGRLIPGIRTLISVPAGIELMPFGPFLIWTTLGSLIWTTLLTTGGIIFGESYSRIEAFIDPFSKAIKLLLLFGIICLFIFFIIRSFVFKKKS